MIEASGVILLRVGNFAPSHVEYGTQNSPWGIGLTFVQRSVFLGVRELKGTNLFHPPPQISLNLDSYFHGMISLIDFFTWTRFPTSVAFLHRMWSP